MKAQWLLVALALPLYGLVKERQRAADLAAYCATAKPDSTGATARTDVLLRRSAAVPVTPGLTRHARHVPGLITIISAGGIRLDIWPFVLRSLRAVESREPLGPLWQYSPR